MTDKIDEQGKNKVGVDLLLPMVFHIIWLKYSNFRREQ